MVPLVGWGVQAVLVRTRRGAGDVWAWLKPQMPAVGGCPQVLTTQRGLKGSGRVGLAWASGLLAAFNVWVWGFPSLAPGLFSLRQSSGLRRLVPGIRRLYFVLCPEAVTPRRPGDGGQRARGKDRWTECVTPGCSCQAMRPQPARHPPTSAGAERALQRGPCLCRPVCLSGGWMSVYRRPPAAPRAQPLPGVSGPADDVSIWGPRLGEVVCWILCGPGV